MCENPETDLIRLINIFAKHLGSLRGIGDFALYRAALAGQLEALKILLANDANPLTPIDISWGREISISAALRGDSSAVIDHLLEVFKGREISEEVASLILQNGLEYGDTKVAEFALSISDRDNLKSSNLFRWAINSKCKTAPIKFLLEQGFSPLNPTPEPLLPGASPDPLIPAAGEQYSPLEEAIDEQCYNLIPLLRPSYEESSSELVKALFFVVKEGLPVEPLKTLLDIVQGVKIAPWTLQDEEGLYLVHHASASPNKAILEELIRRDYPLHLPAFTPYQTFLHDGFLPIHLAALKGTGEHIRLLVEAGQFVDSEVKVPRLESTLTPMQLILALECNDPTSEIEKVKTLLTLGANLNDPIEDGPFKGFNILHLAALKRSCKYHYSPYIDSLSKSGDFDGENPQGNTFVDILMRDRDFDSYFLREILLRRQFDRAKLKSWGEQILEDPIVRNEGDYRLSVVMETLINEQEGVDRKLAQEWRKRASHFSSLRETLEILEDYLGKL
jgi:hypothetical protein